jgi:hypothetical protein
MQEVDMELHDSSRIYLQEGLPTTSSPSWWKNRAGKNSRVGQSVGSRAHTELEHRQNKRYGKSI